MYWIIINERGQNYKGPQGFTEKNKTAFIFPTLSFFQQSFLCLLAIHFVSINVDIARTLSTSFFLFKYVYFSLVFFFLKDILCPTFLF